MLKFTPGNFPHRPHGSEHRQTMVVMVKYKATEPREQPQVAVKRAQWEQKHLEDTTRSHRVSVPERSSPPQLANSAPLLQDSGDFVILMQNHHDQTASALIPGVKPGECDPYRQMQSRCRWRFKRAPASVNTGSAAQIEMEGKEDLCDCLHPDGGYNGFGLLLSPKSHLDTTLSVEELPKSQQVLLRQSQFGGWDVYGSRGTGISFLQPPAAFHIRWALSIGEEASWGAQPNMELRESTLAHGAGISELLLLEITELHLHELLWVAHVCSAGLTGADENTALGESQCQENGALEKNSEREGCCHALWPSFSLFHTSASSKPSSLDFPAFMLIASATERENTENDTRILMSSHCGIQQRQPN
ncbi:hypothetical protein NQZ68_001077 [Dissostichus eleginoides]|nr:hypothetical protein NQZ68_001077 [Dissostichus eleginoides]